MVGRGGQENDLGRRASVADAPAGADPSAVAQVQVDDDDVGLDRLGQRLGLVDGGGLAAHDHVGGGAHEGGQGGPNNRVVVDHHDPNPPLPHCCPGSSTATGAERAERP